MYDILKYIRTAIKYSAGHLIQNNFFFFKNRKHINFYKPLYVEDNEENNSTDISLNVNDLEEIGLLNDNDIFLVYDSTNEKIKKVKLLDLKTYLNS